LTSRAPIVTDFDPRRGSLLLVIGLALLAGYVGYYATGFSALSDYFIFTAEYAQNNLGWRLYLQFFLGIGLYLIFAMLLYRRVISPAKGTAATLPANVVELIARIVILNVPAAALGYLLVVAALLAARGTWVIWSAAALVLVTALAQIAMAIFSFWSAAALVLVTALTQIAMAIFSFMRIWPLRNNVPSLTPPKTAEGVKPEPIPSAAVEPPAETQGATDAAATPAIEPPVTPTTPVAPTPETFAEAGAPLNTIRLLRSASVAAFALYLWIWSDVIGATFFVGGVGIILLFLICLLLILEVLFWLNGTIRGIYRLAGRRCFGQPICRGFLTGI
jgi:hypothetical protein